MASAGRRVSRLATDILHGFQKETYRVAAELDNKYFTVNAKLYEGWSKVTSNIFFLSNYLLTMYEIHTQYNWMFPLHMLLFPPNLHLR